MVDIEDTGGDSSVGVSQDFQTRITTSTRDGAWFSLADALLKTIIVEKFT